MKLKGVQKSATEPFESPDKDFKIKHVNVHETIEKQMKTLSFEALKANWEGQICIEKVLGIRF